MGVDVHEKREAAGSLDHNPNCSHRHGGPPAWVVRKIATARLARERRRRQFYYDYKK